MKLYTKTGDTGDTDTYKGQRTPKASAIVCAYGDIDELIAHLGLLRALTATGSEAKTVEQIQQVLFAVGSNITPQDGGTTAEHYGGAAGGTESPDIFTTTTALLEQRIDGITAQLPPLHNFVLPGNSVAEAQCHVCRTVCRRAERAVAALAATTPMTPHVMAFLNRLSDYLFVFARNLNFITQQGEKTWNKTCR